VPLFKESSTGVDGAGGARLKGVVIEQGLGGSVRRLVPVPLAPRANQTAQQLVQAHRWVTLLPKSFGMRELQAFLDVFLN